MLDVLQCILRQSAQQKIVLHPAPDSYITLDTYVGGKLVFIKAPDAKANLIYISTQSTVRPHLTSSIGSAILREITCTETSVTTGKLVSTRVKFLWHLTNMVMKRR